MRDKWKILFIGLVLILTLNGCSMTSDQETIKITNELDACVIKDVEENDFSGAILVAKDGKVLLSKGYGVADLGKKTENTSKTIFEINSLTKQFTAMGIMILEDEGLLEVDDPIIEYIPDFPRGDEITIHHLLTHTSGIPQIIDFHGRGGGKYNLTPEKIVQILKNKPLRFEPGEEYEYRNSNYALLGCIIENVSGMKYEAFLKKHILKPLRMRSTGQYKNDSKLENKAKGYFMYRALLPMGYTDMSTGYAAWDMYSTVEDLYKWDQALYTERLVSNETLEKIFTPYAQNYGYGWLISEIEKNGHIQQVVSHDGHGGGFTDRIIRNIDDKTTIIVLCNRGGQDLTTLIRDIYEVLESNN